jgi:hypothetical protein
VSAADGQYAIADIEEADGRLVPRKTGDLRSALSALDASYILQAVAGTRTLQPLQALAADVTGDGTVSALDATRILQMVVGLPPGFVAAQRCGSDWLFVPVPAAVPNQSLIQPLAGPTTCQPGAIAYSPLATDATGQDWQAVPIGDVTGNWGS